MNARIIHKSLLAGLACFFLSTALSWGQVTNIEKDTDYQQLLTLQDQAKAALEEGDYEKAYQLSQEGNKSSSLLYERFLAKRALKEAEKKLTLTKSYKADITYPDLYKQANQDYTDANAAYDKQDYPVTVELAEKIIKDLDENMAAIVAAYNAEKNKTKITGSEEQVFPKYYKVRLLPQSRDCFWKIAAYSFIYHNGLQWKRLYEANKHKIPDLNNPDLIYPGIIFEIPSLKGEKREGTYDPQKKYPTFKSH